jgi:Ti-type conjugative transfer relaxase TraA
VAIQFARARYISRSAGGSAVRSAAYNGREAVTAERTGELYYFRHRDAPEYHEVLLPEGAADRYRNIGVLWNAAEAAEKRKDAQVAREIVLALPANTELNGEDRIELARSFAERHFVAKGLAVQLDVHAPHEGESESERANWHAHLLITTRRLEGEAFAVKKARDLDPEVRRAGGRAVVADGEAWGALWRDHQNQYFQEYGLSIEVDPTAAHSGQHIGPVRMRKAGAEILERAKEIRQVNEAAARDPEQVLAALTRHNATFTERDVDRYLGKHVADAAERAATRAKIFEHQGVVILHDRESGETVGRFTTRAVREQEQAVLADAAKLARAHMPAVRPTTAGAALTYHPLRADQRAAFEHAVGPGQLKLIEGRAGTGKSFTLAAIRQAHALEGRRVIGLAPTNTVAQDLAASGFGEAATVHAALFRLKNGRDAWNARTVLVVDEAAMLDARITGELLVAARQACAKVVLTGDDRQLASIERGGLFTEMRQRHGAAGISEVTRQRTDWQRQAARDLGEGRFAEAVAAFDQAGAITWTQNQEEARAALVATWTRDIATQPGARRFVFAYTNHDVDALNAELRQVRRARGELGSHDARLATKHGEADFAIGDRVQFTDTDKRMHIYNGNVGTITSLDSRTGQLTARLDSEREVSWSALEFQGFRHGYAGTIYKGQGKTLDHTYLYHTNHWRSAASYVALTRQRESTQVFVARETARDAVELARQMAREEVKAASVAWATHDELTVRQAERAKVARQQVQEQERPAREEDRPRAKVRAALDAPQRQVEQSEPEWLIPPYVNQDGRDSLGRGLDPASITAAIAADARVNEARAEPWRHLERAYRDPYAAHDWLNELIKAAGWRGAAARVQVAPELLGRLLGGRGMFASRTAQLNRADAISAARSVGYSLTRIVEAEQQAEREYQASVTAQIARDKVGVPKLSTEAAAVLEAVHAAASRGVETNVPWHQREPEIWTQTRNAPAVAKAWEDGRRNPAVAAEIDRFEEASRQRLGEEGLTTAFRAARDGVALSVPGTGPEHQQALRQMARGLVAAQRGRADHDVQRTMEAHRQREQQQERARHRHGPSVGIGR